MPKVDKYPSPAGRLDPLGLPRRRSTATAATFGGGRVAEQYTPTAFGYGKEYHPYQPGKSGLQLLAETVSDVAAKFSDTAEGVVKANNAAAVTKNLLANRAEWLGIRTELEKVGEGTGEDPGDYVGGFRTKFDEWKKGKLEGLSGDMALAAEDDLNRYGMSEFEGAVQHQASRQREHREQQSRMEAENAKDEMKSFAGLAMTDPRQRDDLVQMARAKIQAAEHLDTATKAILDGDVEATIDTAVWAGKEARGEDPYYIRDAMQRGDPAEIGAVEPDARLGFISRANSDIRSLEAEARAQAAEARAIERERIQNLKEDQRWNARGLIDNMKEVSDARMSGRPADPQAVKALYAHGEQSMKEAIDEDTKYAIAQGLQGLQAAENVADIANVASGIPLPQLARELEKRTSIPAGLDDVPGLNDQITVMQKVLDERLTALKQNKTIEYAKTHSRLLKMEPVSWQNPNSSVVREKQSATVAYSFGLSPDGDHQRLDEEEATAIVEELNTAETGDQVRTMVSGYLGLLDDTARRQWLRELGSKKLNPLVERIVAAELDRDDKTGARRLAGAMAVKPEDMPKLPTATMDEINAAVQARIDAGGSHAGASLRDYRATQDPYTNRRAADDDTALRWVTRNYVGSLGMEATAAAEQAERDLYGDTPTSGSESLQWVPPPRDTDPDEWTDVLERARANFYSEKYAPVPGVPDYYRESQLEVIRSDGIWRKGPGDSYQLMEPTSKAAVGTFTANQVRAMAGGATAPASLDPSSLGPQRPGQR